MTLLIIASETPELVEYLNVSSFYVLDRILKISTESRTIHIV